LVTSGLFTIRHATVEIIGGFSFCSAIHIMYQLFVDRIIHRTLFDAWRESLKKKENLEEHTCILQILIPEERAMGEGRG